MLVFRKVRSLREYLQGKSKKNIADFVLEIAKNKFYGLAKSIFIQCIANLHVYFRDLNNYCHRLRLKGKR